MDAPDISILSTADKAALLAGINPQQLKYALSTAQKKLTTTVNKNIRKEVRQIYAVKARDIVRPALDQSAFDLTMSLKYRAPRMSLAKFNPQQRGVQTGTVLSAKTRGLAAGLYEKKRKTVPRNSGVYVRIRKDKRAELVRADGKFGSFSKSGNKGFMARGRRGKYGPIDNGIVQVWARAGKARLPIEKLTAPAAPQMVGNPAVVARAMEAVKGRYETLIDHELDYRLGKQLSRMFTNELRKV